MALCFDFFFVEDAWADYIPVIVKISCDNPARAVAVAEFFLVGPQALQDSLNLLFVRVHLVARFFRVFLREL